MQKSTLVICFALPCVAMLAQTPDPALTFDVASVRPHPPGPSSTPNGMRGGPGTDDPGQISYIGVQLSSILTASYKIYLNQLTGPDWLRTERYDIVAKVPAGATKDQLSIMFQNLLKERFNMTAHREFKEQPVYDLVVGKNGSKLKEAASPNPAGEPYKAGSKDTEGFPELPAGSPRIAMNGGKGANRMSARMQPLWDVIGMLNGMVDRPILDKTGLTGKYDFKLGFSQGADGDLPSIFDAVQSQLGLKLEPAKGQVEHLVIDHIDKTPTPN